MFETITGNYTAYDATGITDSSKNFVVDFYKNWIVTVGSTEYNCTGNTAQKLLFSNSLAATGSYKIEFANRNLLVRYESDMSDTVKVPDALITKKLLATVDHFTQKIKANFRNLYLNYDDSVDPLSLIYNLSEIQTAFCYYAIAEIYADLKVSYDDNAQMKEQDFRNRYKEIIKDCISLLAVDEDQSGTITNSEKATSAGKGVLLSR